MLANMSVTDPKTTPLIVITVADPSASADPALASRKNELYADAIRRHGGDAALVHAGTAPEERARLFGEMRGLLLAGGADINPALYHEAPAGADDLDHARDEMELAAWSAAGARRLPVLGICRGLQAMNVFLGGTLLQDVPDHSGVAFGTGRARTHNLEIDPESRLAEALAQGDSEGLAATDEDDPTVELIVNTFHHQAITRERLAPGLRPVGWAHSGSGRLVEAAESRDDRWLVGIQCHPERTDSTPDEFEGLFAAFVRAVREASEASV
jgi:putative glutamine amidotransferase